MLYFHTKRTAYVALPSPAFYEFSSAASCSGVVGYFHTSDCGRCHSSSMCMCELCMCMLDGGNPGTCSLFEPEECLALTLAYMDCAPQ